jgi:hypothetical protein
MTDLLLMDLFHAFTGEPHPARMERVSVSAESQTKTKRDMQLLQEQQKRLNLGG